MNCYRIGMSVAIPQGDDSQGEMSRRETLGNLSRVAQELIALSLKIEGSGVDVYTAGYQLQDLLYSIGQQLEQTVNRNLPSVEDVKRLVSLGHVIEAIKLYKAHAKCDLLTAKKYVDKLRGV